MQNKKSYRLVWYAEWYSSGVRFQTLSQFPTLSRATRGEGQLSRAGNPFANNGKKWGREIPYKVCYFLKGFPWL